GTIDIWDASASKLERTLRPKGGIWALAWRPDGGALACRHRTAVTVWDPDSGQLLHKLETDPQGQEVAWTPDGDRLATSGQDGRIRVWNLRTNSNEEFETKPPRAKSWRIWGLAWHPDGARIAAGGRFGISGVWDTRARKWLFLRDRRADSYPVEVVA